MVVHLMLLSFKNYLSTERNIVLFMYLFLFLTPWNLIKSQVAIFSVLLLLIALFKYKSELSSKIKLLYAFKPLFILFLFVIYLFISTLWSESFAEGFKRVFNFHKYEFLFVPALLLLNKEQAKTAIKVLLISFVLYAFFSLFIYFDIIHIAGSTSENPKGVLRFSISTQYMVVTAFSALFFFLHKGKETSKYIYLLMSVISVWALSVNYSRTSQLAFFFIALIFIFLFVKQKHSLKLYIASFVIVLVVLVTFSQNTKIMNKFNHAISEVEKIYTNDTYSGSFGVRLYFNKVGLDIIKNNFLFGMGPVDNRTELVKREGIDEHYNAPIIKHFHSEHMEILTAYGVVGYSLLAVSIILLIYKLRSDVLYFNIGLSVFLTLFFVSFANKTLALKPLNYVYIIFFVLLSIIAYYNEQENKSSDNK